ncbi:MAG: DnaJ domain-containing protein [Chroococcales cyanobacterium]
MFYYRLGKQYHPDKNSSEKAQERMQRINQAYELFKRERC